MAAPGKFTPGFLDTMDRRTEVYQIMRERLDTILADLGGATEQSHIKTTLAEKFIWMQAHLETMEAEMCTGKVDRDATMGKWIQGVNALVGLAKTLGLERQTKGIDLATYLGNGGNKQ